MNGRAQRDGTADAIVHAISVDVEDYFHVAAFRNSVDPANWHRLESRVERNTERCLELFDRVGVKGTFFILGWVAERLPSLVRRISEAGHELGCHSHVHRFVYDLQPSEFRQDTVAARGAIQDACGAAVTLYRAPSFSITPRSAWSLEVLAELGFTIDSSVFPIRHDLYGFTGAPSDPFQVMVNGASMIEFPPPTASVGSWRFPITGGGYLRLLPMWWQLHSLERLERQGSPFVIYFHPWELDPEQPRLQGPFRSKIRHYTGLRRTSERLLTLTTRFRFGTISDCLNARELSSYELRHNGRTGVYEFAPLSGLQRRSRSRSQGATV